MLTKRIIPCLDIKDGKVVKGTNFVSLRYAGDPVELGRIYEEKGADELVFLDIAASYEKRKTKISLVKKVAKNIFIPFTVGGGIKDIDDIKALLNAGADKISINTSAVKNPGLIKKAARKFGSQCIVVAIDSKDYKVYVNGGRDKTDLNVLEWAKKIEELGAGEILLTSIDRDGTKTGYDIGLIKQISKSVNIPIISSGGAGSLKDILNVLKYGKADAALAASIFHYGKCSINQVKNYLIKNGVRIRK